MPLTICPDCQNSVSDAAPSCPHCGRPLRYIPPPPQQVQTTRSGGGGLWEGVGFVLIIVGLVGSFITMWLSPLMAVGLAVFIIGRFQ